MGSQVLSKSEVRQQWVAALRSGKYKQGTSRLRWNKETGDEYCCLGVLCELAVKEGVIPNPTLNKSPDFYLFGGESSGSTAFIPEEVRIWAGLQRCSGKFDTNSLYMLNDAEHKTFEEIADVIESNPPGLFVEEK